MGVDKVMADENVLMFEVVVPALVSGMRAVSLIEK